MNRPQVTVTQLRSKRTAVRSIHVVRLRQPPFTDPPYRFHLINGKKTDVVTVYLPRFQNLGRYSPCS